MRHTYKRSFSLFFFCFDPIAKRRRTRTNAREDLHDAPDPLSGSKRDIIRLPPLRSISFGDSSRLQKREHSRSIRHTQHTRESLAPLRKWAKDVEERKDGDLIDRAASRREQKKNRAAEGRSTHHTHPNHDREIHGFPPRVKLFPEMGKRKGGVWTGRPTHSP